MSATAVSALVTCITGQTPPRSASAISSAASDFMRRKSRITSRFVAGRCGGTRRLGKNGLEAGVGIGFEQREEAAGFDPDQLPEIGRSRRDAGDKVFELRLLGKEVREPCAIGSAGDLPRANR